MKNKKIIIGSRGSKLALIYAERAKVELLKKSNKPLNLWVLRIGERVDLKKREI